MAQATCSIDDCDKPVKARGWCSRHYHQWHRTGSPLRTRTRATCTVEGCSKVVNGRGYCTTHYRRWQRTGDPLGFVPRRPRGTCSVDGCSSPTIALGYCNGHYSRLKKWGDVKADVPLTPSRYKDGAQCSEVDCDLPTYCKGMCRPHYARILYGSDSGRPVTPRSGVIDEQGRRRCVTCLDFKVSSQFTSRQTPNVCEACVRAATFRANAARRMRMRWQFVEDVVPEVVFERDGWLCQMCGCELTRSLPYPHPRYPEVDHVDPISRGGDHSYANTRAACSTCNRAKSDRIA